MKSNKVFIKALNPNPFHPPAPRPHIGFSQFSQFNQFFFTGERFENRPYLLMGERMEGLKIGWEEWHFKGLKVDKKKSHSLLISLSRQCPPINGGEKVPEKCRWEMEIKLLFRVCCCEGLENIFPEEFAVEGRSWSSCCCCDAMIYL
jgi:hypothetical protein